MSTAPLYRQVLTALSFSVSLSQRHWIQHIHSQGSRLRKLIMDPLSVTLAVVTLTTAVKDLVELGQKIHDSFAKVSNIA